MSEETPLRTLVCAHCGVLLASNLRDMPPDTLLEEDEGHDIVPRGWLYHARAGIYPGEPGDFVINRKDVQNAE